MQLASDSSQNSKMWTRRKFQGLLCHSNFLLGFIVGILFFYSLDPYLHPPPQDIEPDVYSADNKQLEPTELRPRDESKQPIGLEAYKQALLRYSKDGLIFLSSVDMGYLEMGLNLYYTSLQKHGFDNYLFVASDNKVCPELSRHNIHCVQFMHAVDSDKPSLFYTKEFKLKSFLKTKLVLEALKFNLKVFLVDVDMYFVQNPMGYMRCEKCDIEAMVEWARSGVINTGFYLAKPTNASIQLHERAVALIDKDSERDKLSGSDQKYVNDVLKEMRSNLEIVCKLLDEEAFPNALTYFEFGDRIFTGQNRDSKAVVVHNNFVTSLEAKIYRFKEYGYWDLDINGYYSNTSTKYLTYDNVINWKGPLDKTEIILRERAALKTALKLGHMLNRVVILPKFHNHRERCKGAKTTCKIQWETCSFQGVYYVAHLDEQFAGHYREQSFLSHPKVPQSVSRDKSPVFLLESPYFHEELKKVPANVTLLEAKNFTQGLSAANIKSYFDKVASSYSVLRFHSLYVNIFDYKLIDKELSKAFTRSQWNQVPKGDTFLKKFNLTV